MPRSALTVHGESHVTWFRSSEKVRRGFCSKCGSALFWDPLGRDWTSLAMGAFDTATDTKLAMHIHVASKGDYYEVSDDVPKYEGFPTP